MDVVLWFVAVAAALGWVRAALARRDAARDAAVAALVRALAAKDPYTGEHTERVARYSVYIAEELDWPRRHTTRLRQAALLHDIGKLAVPSDLLNKPGPLTDREVRELERHTHVCIDILDAVDALRPLAAAAAGHHRRYDGGGYGSGGRSRDAAVVAVADAYDAMTSTRAYRRALPQAVAVEELRRQAGTQFDPVFVDALVRALGRRGERHGLGFERSTIRFAVDPPVRGPASPKVDELARGASPG
jgi:HD-GYP domain-containing protein (c-di-GMP phosphodiesterase class II)